MFASAMEQNLKLLHFGGSQNSVGFSVVKIKIKMKM